ncbi:uncharacterized protein MJAP1_002197 [Malassezia japonica]|uniref:rRNA-processing protein FYV7 n=1 Tax=Malassezia japonica TaxID=223818 RepID=A0AAF0JFS2_9BASI|nr:uncharacterized protein MJAP1_002197 [Malassezia japonica]WFD39226.1 hypothetical protein MJAP1_002197 [Malassezia japonica]
MARLDGHKRSVVKHRTRAPQGQRPRGGFSVGATNVPSGAYIGRAKKLKADLIHKAKVKKAYNKLLEREGAPAEMPEPEETQDLGRFAPEDPADDLLEQVEKKDERPRATAERPTKKKLPYFHAPPKKKEPKAEGPKRTAEQAMQEREARRALWNKKSPSAKGRARGQPDLGARMEVMLDKIQRNA